MCTPVHVHVCCIEAACHPFYREEACSLVIGLFRSQEGAPSSEEETHILSRCLLLAGTRLRRDETSSLCMCARMRVHKNVWDRGVSLLISNHFTQVSPVHIGCQTVEGHGLLSQASMSSVAINSGPEASCALRGSLLRKLLLQ